MSRIGRKAIQVPAGVNVTLDNTLITVKGPKGTLSRELHKDMKIIIAENEISVERPSDHKLHRSLHGTTRSVVANMVNGVTEGFQKKHWSLLALVTALAKPAIRSFLTLVTPTRLKLHQNPVSNSMFLLIRKLS